MLFSSAILFASLFGLVPAETVLGVYIFHRHGDRTTKSYPPTKLTTLGYDQVYTSGDFYRNRYIEANASSPIFGISSNTVKNSQLNVQAPVDTVLQNSAAGFLQGLYPPVGASLGSQTLGNGTTVEAPLDGFQLIPVNVVASASTSANSENSAWLQGASGCLDAITSSNDYFYSTEYIDLLNSTADFYESLLPVINTTFTSGTDTFKNAYSIYDYIHVSTIHNTSDSIPSDDLLTDSALSQLQTLANTHEFNLAYNASSTIRAIAGSTLAAQILTQLNSTITGSSKTPVSIQFGAYGAFLSFFGLANLPAVSVNFTGIVDYASSMAFELVTNATVTNTSYPSSSDISVRFLFANGTAASNPLTPYPLFNSSSLTLPWSDFASQMGDIAIGDQASWCAACGNTTGVCASSVTGIGSGSSSSDSSSKGGLTAVQAGAIGACVTIAVILGLEALIVALAGLKLVKKSTIAGTSAVQTVGKV